MKLSQFFISRPIFAGVLSAVIFLAGLIALPRLPISEYPEVVPPTVVVKANYPGANPKVIADTVASPLEQSINGVEGMLYQSSQATADGVMTLTVTFALNTDVDKAQVQVQNRVSQALPKLPDVVQRLGVTTNKASPDLTMVVHLVSPDNRYDTLYLSNYALLRVKDELARLDGVGDVQVFGAGQFSMRIWLDPEKVASRNLSADDVVRAIREQNVQVAAGQLGAPPLPAATEFQVAINAKGRLTTEEDFRNIVIKTGASGQVTRLKDVARVELGSDTYALRALLDNKAAAAIPVFQRPGSNAIAISEHVRAKMQELKRDFPEGVDYKIVYDPTVFVRGSINAVVDTLLKAILLVVLVVIVFLQTWRASVIPLIAVPVSLVGTFAAMYAFGFSLNALSLFGLVLAIGIVVDDAIVVVENVQRNIANGLTPFAATQKAMSEVTGPIVATALVLCAVFVPTAFISGLSGQFYRQFALTIAFSTVISAFNSLTLSPALAALLLKGQAVAPDRLTRLLNQLLGGFFRPFNRLFARLGDRYVTGVGHVFRASAIALLIYGGLITLAYFGFASVPTGFIPQQDKQYLVSFAQLPDAATLDRTEAVIRRMSDIALKQPGVESAVAFPGLSINGFTNSPNSGIVFVTLKPFEERRTKALSAGAIAGALNQKYAGIQESFIAVFPPPPVQGLGTIGGFRMQVEDRGGVGFEELFRQTQQLIGDGRQAPELQGLFSSYQVNVPQVDADVDRDKAKAQGVSVQDLFDTMQVYLGSLYVNDFNAFGRTYPVTVQAEPEFRLQAEDVVRLKTRNAAGDMVPLGSILTVRRSSGPDRVMHYNSYPTAEITGGPAPGYSSGQAQAAIERLARRDLPNGMAFEWTELTYQQLIAGNTAVWIFPLVVLLAFLVLAAQYESLTLPIAVILIMPMVLLSAITGIALTHGDNNIFTQISLIVLVGLASKNAILIVEFARDRELEGTSPVQAALDAARLRLRPILMTSLAFIMGVVPLVTSSGAGAEMRHAMGIAVFSGMLGVTVFGLMLTPLFYVLVRRIVRRPLAHAGAIPAISAPPAALDSSR
jgi:multidrug efflux pump